MSEQIPHDLTVSPTNNSTKPPAQSTKIPTLHSNAPKNVPRNHRTPPLARPPLHLPRAAYAPLSLNPPPLTPPVTLLLGSHAALTSPTTFISTQLPHPTPVSPSAILLSYTLGSLFLLLFGFAVVCTVLTRDARVTKYYLLMLMCGDLGHLAANYAGMGGAVFWGVGGWNQMMWGNIAVTAFLFVNRGCTVAGVFGRPGWVEGGRVKRV